MKYDTIIQCDLRPYFGSESGYENEKGIIPNVYLLTYNNCNEELEIDLCADMFFNVEFETLNRKEIIKVKDYNELLDFMDSHNIPTKIYHKDNRNYVGGSKDYVLNDRLEVLGWAEELEQERDYELQ